MAAELNTFFDDYGAMVWHLCKEESVVPHKAVEEVVDASVKIDVYPGHTTGMRLHL